MDISQRLLNITFNANCDPLEASQQLAERLAHQERTDQMATPTQAQISGAMPSLTITETALQDAATRLLETNSLARQMYRMFRLDEPQGASTPQVEALYRATMDSQLKSSQETIDAMLRHMQVSGQSSDEVTQTLQQHMASLRDAIDARIRGTLMTNPQTGAEQILQNLGVTSAELAQREGRARMLGLLTGKLESGELEGNTRLCALEEKARESMGRLRKALDDFLVADASRPGQTPQPAAYLTWPQNRRDAWDASMALRKSLEKLPVITPEQRAKLQQLAQSPTTPEQLIEYLTLISGTYKKEIPNGLLDEQGTPAKQLLEAAREDARKLYQQFERVAQQATPQLRMPQVTTKPDAETAYTQAQAELAQTPEYQQREQALQAKADRLQVIENRLRLSALVPGFEMMQAQPEVAFAQQDTYPTIDTFKEFVASRLRTAQTVQPSPSQEAQRQAETITDRIMGFTTQLWPEIEEQDFGQLRKETLERMFAYQPPMNQVLPGIDREQRVKEQIEALTTKNWELARNRQEQMVRVLERAVEIQQGQQSLDQIRAKVQQGSMVSLPDLMRYMNREDAPNLWDHVPPGIDQGEYMLHVLAALQDHLGQRSPQLRNDRYLGAGIADLNGPTPGDGYLERLRNAQERWLLSHVQETRRSQGSLRSLAHSVSGMDIYQAQKMLRDQIARQQVRYRAEQEIANKTPAIVALERYGLVGSRGLSQWGGRVIPNYSHDQASKTLRDLVLGSVNKAVQQMALSVRDDKAMTAAQQELTSRSRDMIIDEWHAMQHFGLPPEMEAISEFLEEYSKLVLLQPQSWRGGVEKAALTTGYDDDGNAIMEGIHIDQVNPAANKFRHLNNYLRGLQEMAQDPSHALDVKTNSQGDLTGIRVTGLYEFIDPHVPRFDRGEKIPNFEDADNPINALDDPHARMHALRGEDHQRVIQRNPAAGFQNGFRNETMEHWITTLQTAEAHLLALAANPEELTQIKSGRDRAFTKMAIIAFLENMGKLENYGAPLGLTIQAQEGADSITDIVPKWVETLSQYTPEGQVQMRSARKRLKGLKGEQYRQARSQILQEARNKAFDQVVGILQANYGIGGASPYSIHMPRHPGVSSKWIERLANTLQSLNLDRPGKRRGASGAAIPAVVRLRDIVADPAFAQSGTTALRDQVSGQGRVGLFNLLQFLADPQKRIGLSAKLPGESEEEWTTSLANSVLSPRNYYITARSKQSAPWIGQTYLQHMLAAYTTPLVDSFQQFVQKHPEAEVSGFYANLEHTALGLMSVAHIAGYGNSEKPRQASDELDSFFQILHNPDNFSAEDYTQMIAGLTQTGEHARLTGKVSLAEVRERLNQMHMGGIAEKAFAHYRDKADWERQPYTRQQGDLIQTVRAAGSHYIIPGIDEVAVGQLPPVWRLLDRLYQADLLPHLRPGEVLMPGKANQGAGYGLARLGKLGELFTKKLAKPIQRLLQLGKATRGPEITKWNFANYDTAFVQDGKLVLGQELGIPAEAKKIMRPDSTQQKRFETLTEQYSLLYGMPVSMAQNLALVEMLNDEHGLSISAEDLQALVGTLVGGEQGITHTQRGVQFEAQPIPGDSDGKMGLATIKHLLQSVLGYTDAQWAEMQHASQEPMTRPGITQIAQSAVPGMLEQLGLGSGGATPSQLPLSSGVTYRQGDIFASSMAVLTNPINTAGAMGAGLAKAFRDRYPEMYQDYRERAKAKQLQPGQPYVYGNVLNFPTKRHWNNPSQLGDIEAGLQYLVEHAQEMGITSLAVPGLGTGLGGLTWNDVGPLLDQYLGQLAGQGIPVEVYLPSGVSPDDWRNGGSISPSIMHLQEYSGVQIYDPAQSSVFWTLQGENGSLSNFAHQSLTLAGKTYPTPEHLYQALKFDGNEEMMNKIRQALTAKEAKRIAHQHSEQQSPSWDQEKIQTMYRVEQLRLQQSPEFAQALQATGQFPIVERSEKDTFWGAIQNNGQLIGQNVLGRILTDLRDNIDPIVPGRASRKSAIPPGGSSLEKAIQAQPEFTRRSLTGPGGQATRAAIAKGEITYGGRTFGGLQDQGWGNRFRERDPQLIAQAHQAQMSPRDFVIKLHHDWIMEKTRHDPAFRAQLLALKASGQDIACWCPPGEACHVDNIREAMNLAEQIEQGKGGDGVLIGGQGLQELAKLQEQGIGSLSQSVRVTQEMPPPAAQTALSVGGRAPPAYHLKFVQSRLAQGRYTDPFSRRHYQIAALGLQSTNPADQQRGYQQLALIYQRGIANTFGEEALTKGGGPEAARMRMVLRDIQAYIASSPLQEAMTAPASEPIGASESLGTDRLTSPQENTLKPLPFIPPGSRGGFPADPFGHFFYLQDALKDQHFQGKATAEDYEDILAGLRGGDVATQTDAYSRLIAIYRHDLKNAPPARQTSLRALINLAQRHVQPTTNRSDTVLGMNLFGFTPPRHKGPGLIPRALQSIQNLAKQIGQHLPMSLMSLPGGSQEELRVPDYDPDLIRTGLMMEFLAAGTGRNNQIEDILGKVHILHESYTAINRGKPHNLQSYNDQLHDLYTTLEQYGHNRTTLTPYWPELSVIADEAYVASNLAMLHNQLHDLTSPRGIDPEQLWKFREQYIETIQAIDNHDEPLDPKRFIPDYDEIERVFDMTRGWVQSVDDYDPEDYYHKSSASYEWTFYHDDPRLVHGRLPYAAIGRPTIAQRLHRFAGNFGKSLPMLLMADVRGSRGYLRKAEIAPHISLLDLPHNHPLQQALRKVASPAKLQEARDHLFRNTRAVQARALDQLAQWYQQLIKEDPLHVADWQALLAQAQDSLETLPPPKSGVAKEIEIPQTTPRVIGLPTPRPKPPPTPRKTPPAALRPPIGMLAHKKRATISRDDMVAPHLDLLRGEDGADYLAALQQAMPETDFAQLQAALTDGSDHVMRQAFQQLDQGYHTAAETYPDQSEYWSLMGQWSQENIGQLTPEDDILGMNLPFGLGKFLPKADQPGLLNRLFRGKGHNWHAMDQHLTQSADSYHRTLYYHSLEEELAKNNWNRAQVRAGYHPLDLLQAHYQDSRAIYQARTGQKRIPFSMYLKMLGTALDAALYHHQLQGEGSFVSQDQYTGQIIGTTWRLPYHIDNWSNSLGEESQRLELQELHERHTGTYSPEVATFRAHRAATHALREAPRVRIPNRDPYAPGRGVGRYPSRLGMLARRLGQGARAGFKRFGTVLLQAGGPDDFDELFDNLPPPLQGVEDALAAAGASGIPEEAHPPSWDAITAILRERQQELAKMHPYKVDAQKPGLFPQMAPPLAISQKVDIEEGRIKQLLDDIRDRKKAQLPVTLTEDEHQIIQQAREHENYIAGLQPEDYELITSPQQLGRRALVTARTILGQDTGVASSAPTTLMTPILDALARAQQIGDKETIQAFKDQAKGFLGTYEKSGLGAIMGLDQEAMALIHTAYDAWGGDRSSEPIGASESVGTPRLMPREVLTPPQVSGTTLGSNPIMQQNLAVGRAHANWKQYLQNHKPDEPGYQEGVRTHAREFLSQFGMLHTMVGDTDEDIPGLTRRQWRAYQQFAGVAQAALQGNSATQSFEAQPFVPSSPSVPSLTAPSRSTPTSQERSIYQMAQGFVAADQEAATNVFAYLTNPNFSSQHLVIKAGPGAGKTQVAASIMAGLLGNEQTEIMALMPTVAAREELQERFTSLATQIQRVHPDYNTNGRVGIMTFAALARRTLGSNQNSTLARQLLHQLTSELPIGQAYVADAEKVSTLLPPKSKEFRQFLRHGVLATGGVKDIQDKDLETIIDNISNAFNNAGHVRELLQEGTKHLVEDPHLRPTDLAAKEGVSPKLFALFAQQLIKGDYTTHDMEQFLLRQGLEHPDPAIQKLVRALLPMDPTHILMDEAQLTTENQGGLFGGIARLTGAQGNLIGDENQGKGPGLTGRLFIRDLTEYGAGVLGVTQPDMTPEEVQNAITEQMMEISLGKQMRMSPTQFAMVQALPKAVPEGTTTLKNPQPNIMVHPGMKPVFHYQPSDWPRVIESATPYDAMNTMIRRMVHAQGLTMDQAQDLAVQLGQGETEGGDAEAYRNYLLLAARHNELDLMRSIAQSWGISELVSRSGERPDLSTPEGQAQFEVYRRQARMSTVPAATGIEARTQVGVYAQDMRYRRSKSTIEQTLSEWSNQYVGASRGYAGGQTEFSIARYQMRHDAIEQLRTSGIVVQGGKGFWYLPAEDGQAEQYIPLTPEEDAKYLQQHRFIPKDQPIHNMDLANAAAWVGETALWSLVASSGASSLRPTNEAIINSAPPRIAATLRAMPRALVGETLQKAFDLAYEKYLKLRVHPELGQARENFGLPSAPPASLQFTDWRDAYDPAQHAFPSSSTSVQEARTQLGSWVRAVRAQRRREPVATNERIIQRITDLEGSIPAPVASYLGRLSPQETLQLGAVLTDPNADLVALQTASGLPVQDFAGIIDYLQTQPDTTWMDLETAPLGNQARRTGRGATQDGQTYTKPGIPPDWDTADWARYQQESRAFGQWASAQGLPKPKGPSRYKLREELARIHLAGKARGGGYEVTLNPAEYQRAQEIRTILARSRGHDDAFVGAPEIHLPDQYRAAEQYFDSAYAPGEAKTAGYATPPHGASEIPAQGAIIVDTHSTATMSGHFQTPEAAPPSIQGRSYPLNNDGAYPDETIGRLGNTPQETLQEQAALFYATQHPGTSLDEARGLVANQSSEQFQSALKELHSALKQHHQGTPGVNSTPISPSEDSVRPPPPRRGAAGAGTPPPRPPRPTQAGTFEPDDENFAWTSQGTGHVKQTVEGSLAGANQGAPRNFFQRFMDSMVGAMGQVMGEMTPQQFNQAIGQDLQMFARTTARAIFELSFAQMAMMQELPQQIQANQQFHLADTLANIYGLGVPDQNNGLLGKVKGNSLINQAKAAMPGVDYATLLQDYALESAYTGAAPTVNNLVTLQATSKLTGLNQQQILQLASQAAVTGKAYSSGTMSQDTQGALLQALQQAGPIGFGDILQAASTMAYGSASGNIAFLGAAGQAYGNSPSSYQGLAALGNTLQQTINNPSLQEEMGLASLYDPKDVLAGHGIAALQNIEKQFPGVATPDSLNQQAEFLNRKVNMEQLSMQLNLHLSQLEINADTAQIAVMATQQAILGEQIQQAQMDLSFQKYIDTAEYGPIGKDISKDAYFDFERSQAIAGRNQLDGEHAVDIGAYKTFGLQNAEFFANVEHQRSEALYQRSPLLGDLAFKEQMHYLDQQEHFYEAELKLRNEERAYNYAKEARQIHWQEMMYAAEGAQIVAQTAILNANKLMLAKTDEWKKEELQALADQQKAQDLALTGQYGLNQNLNPFQFIQQLEQVYKNLNQSQMDALNRALRDQYGPQVGNTLIQIAQWLEMHPQYTGMTPDQLEAALAKSNLKIDPQTLQQLLNGNASSMDQYLTNQNTGQLLTWQNGLKSSVGAMGTVETAFGRMAGFLAPINVGFSALATTFGKIAPIIMSFAGLSTLLSEFMGAASFGKFTGALGGAISAPFKAVGGGVADALGMAGLTMPELLPIIAAIVAAVLALLGLNWLTGNPVGKAAKYVGGAIQQGASWVDQNMINPAEAKIQAFVQWFNQTSFFKNAQGIADDLGQVFGSIIGWISQTPAVKEAGRKIGQIFQILGIIANETGKFIGSLMNTIGPALGALFDILGTLVHAMGQSSKNILSSIGDFITLLHDITFFNWKNIGKDWNKVKNEFGDGLKDLGQGSFDAVKNGLKDIKKIDLSKIWGDLENDLGNLFNAIGTWWQKNVHIDQWWHGITQALGNFFNAIGTWVQKNITPGNIGKGLGTLVGDALVKDNPLVLIIKALITAPWKQIGSTLWDGAQKALWTDNPLVLLVTAAINGFKHIDFSKLLDNIKNINIGDLLLSINPLALIIGAFTKADWPAIGKTLLNAAKQVLITDNPLVIIVKALPAFLGGFFDGMLNSIGDTFGNSHLGDDIGTWFNNQGKNISDWFQKVPSAISNFGSGIGNWFSQRGNDIGDWFKNIGPDIGKAFGSLGKHVSDSITGAFNVTDWVSKLFGPNTPFGQIGANIGSSVNQLFGDGRQFVTNAIKWFLALPDDIKHGITNLWNKGTQFLMDFLKPFQNMVPDIKNVFANIWNPRAFGASVIALFSNLINDIQQIFNNLNLGWIGADLVSAMSNMIKGVLEGLVNWLHSMPAHIGDPAAGLIQNFINGSFSNTQEQLHSAKEGERPGGHSLHIPGGGVHKVTAPTGQDTNITLTIEVKHAGTVQQTGTVKIDPKDQDTIMSKTMDTLQQVLLPFIQSAPVTP